MTSFLAAASAPGTTITTTTETLAVNIPATPITPPPNATAIIVRGRMVITTGTSTTALTAKLRLGQSNTTTAQIDTSDPVDAAAGVAQGVPFEFQDTNLADLGISGYSITVTQTGAAANGTVTSVEYEVDYVIP